MQRPWRRQAREWVRSDLAVWANTLKGGSRAVRVVVSRMLTCWQADTDLAGLREPSALDKLSAAECKECLTLWNEFTSVLNRARTNQ